MNHINLTNFTATGYGSWWWSQFCLKLHLSRYPIKCMFMNINQSTIWESIFVNCIFEKLYWNSMKKLIKAPSIADMFVTTENCVQRHSGGWIGAPEKNYMMKECYSWFSSTWRDCLAISLLNSIQCIFLIFYYKIKQWVPKSFLRVEDLTQQHSQNILQIPKNNYFFPPHIRI